MPLCASSGTIAGVTHSTTPSHVAQALREGVVFRLTEVVRRVRALLGPSRPLALALSGKAVLASPSWRRAFVHTLAAPVHYALDGEPGGARGGGGLEATSLGCLLATHLGTPRAGGAGDAEQWRLVGAPQPGTWACDRVVSEGWVEEYAEAFRRHRVLYDAMRRVQEELEAPL